jgi:hypothetical protein
MATWIVFSEKAPEPEGSGLAATMFKGLRSPDYGILVEEPVEKVADSLGENVPTRLTRVKRGDRVAVYVNPASVLYVEDYGELASAESESESEAA